MRTPNFEISSPNTQASLCTPKEETLSPTMHSQPLPLLSTATSSRTEILPSLNLDKGEAPPPLQHAGPPSSSQSGPSLELKKESPSASVPDFQPRQWEGGCIVEEEIPPSWQVLEDGENIHYLAKEHLELLFDIRQRQDEQAQGQRIINQRLDFLFEAFSDAPRSASCPTCKQKYVPAFTSNGRPGSPLV